MTIQRPAFKDRRAAMPGEAPSSHTGLGDGQVRRYYDPKVKSHVLKVLPGTYKMNQAPDTLLVTVLGSCVSACIRNPRNGYGGMNHFMLPSAKTEQKWGSDELAFRYGNHAMEMLINDVLKSGCRRSELEVKLFGGAAVANVGANVGRSNVVFVRRFIFEEELRITAEDLGGDSPRRIYFNTHTGKVDRLLLRRVGDYDEVQRAETKYRETIVEQPAPEEDDDVELFD